MNPEMQDAIVDVMARMAGMAVVLCGGDGSSRSRIEERTSRVVMDKAYSSMDEAKREFAAVMRICLEELERS